MLFFDSLKDFFLNFSNLFQEVTSIDFRITDLIDIALVAFVIYHAFKLIRDSRAFLLIKGLIVLSLVYFLVYMLGMETSSFIFKLIFKNIFIILIIVFQQEIRQIVERLGNSRFKSIRAFFSDVISSEEVATSQAINETCIAVQRMSDSKTGALIVFEKSPLPSEVATSGKPLDAEVSHELLMNIFFPNSPLHDGAVLIRKGRILRASAVLPNAQDNGLENELGTRHRAALGLSEVCDAVVIVVSEETGTISIARKGKLERGFDEATLRDRVIKYLTVQKPEDFEEPKTFIKRIVKGKKK